MSNRFMQPTRCGSKHPTNAYDPQIAAAAQANTQVAQQAENFSESFYTNQIAPMLAQSDKASQQTQDEQKQLFDINMQQTQQSLDRYQQYGIPAENKYYDMVSKYSSADEQERQATGALGDMRTAEAGQRATINRQMADRGIDPTSPAAMAISGQAGVANSAAEASAMNQARNAARTMGMALTSDAANFGRGGQSGIINFGSAAGNNANAGFNTASGALGAAGGAASVPLAGARVAQTSYGSNLSAYAQLGEADMQAQAAAQAALGSGIGSIIGAGVSKWSDRALKRAIRRVGQMDSGLALYEFEYAWSPAKHIGVMADEAEQMFPGAVSIGFGGYKIINYAALR